MRSEIESEREKPREKAREGRSIAFPNDREKDLSPAPARVGAFCERSPLVRPNSVVAPPLVCPSGRLRRGDIPRGRARRLGSAFAFQNASPIPLSPAPRGFAKVSPKNGRIVRCPSARGSPLKVVASAANLCFASLAGFPRCRGQRGRRGSTLAAAFGGALRAVHIPKTERGGFRSSGLAEKLPRSVFRLRRALPPYPMRGTMPRTIYR